MRKVQEKQWRKTEQQIRENPAHIFKLLRKTGKKANRNSERPSMIQHKDSTTSDPKIVAEQFHQKWNNIFGNKTPQAEPGMWLKEMHREQYDVILKRPILMDTLEEKLKKLKKNKAAGNDAIYNEYLSHLGDAGKTHFLTLLNNIICHNHIPNGWRNSITTMLHKKGDKTDPLNYRPITLLSCAYKVYSSIQTDRLNDWINNNNVLNSNQFGFRTGRETSDAAIRLFTCIANSASTNKAIHVIFLDIAKAYNSVQHWALKDTLVAHGLHQLDIDLIMDMVKGYST